MRNDDIAILKAEARSMKLSYSTDSQPGYTRKRKGKAFTYYNSHNKKITDKDEIARIKALAIPPAWTDVWICPKPNGHLQVTGVDAAGRKQYKYHKQWSVLRNQHKHDHMLDFARVLPKIRKRVEADIRKEEFTKEKVLAMAITVMDKTFIRVGNEAYAKLYGSYGLTSLRNKHIKITGNKMIIAFRGKKGVFQEIKLTHSRLAKMMHKLKDIPGQELFQYYDSNGVKHTIDSDSVNEYIEVSTGKDFTAKDFRTWSGTVEAFSQLAALSNQNTGTPEKNIVSALDAVAKKLGNTRTVCRKYYVHPKLLTSYQEGKLDKYIEQLTHDENTTQLKRHEVEEKLVIRFLEETA